MKTFLFCLSLIASAIITFAQGEAVSTDLDTVSSEVISDGKAELDESIFVNLKAHAKPDGFKVTWSLEYASLKNISDKNLVIKYNTKIGAKRNKKGFEGSDWKYTEPFDINKTSYEVKNLIGAEKYEVYIGLVDDKVKDVSKDSDVIWLSLIHI